MSDSCALDAAPQTAADDCTSLGPTCAGCRHNWYSAPDGQAWNRAPHSRCLHFRADIPMTVVRSSWRRSAIPAGCPTHAQLPLL